VPTAEQLVWLEDLRARGWSTVVAYGANEAIKYLQRLGYGMRGRG
jgi:hypothetical protein